MTRLGKVSLMPTFKIRVIQGSTAKTIIDWCNAQDQTPEDAVSFIVRAGYLDDYEGETVFAQVMTRNGKLIQFDVTIPSSLRIEKTSEREWDDWG